jgi:hypothetical protein
MRQIAEYALVCRMDARAGGGAQISRFFAPIQLVARVTGEVGRYRRPGWMFGGRDLP